MIGTLPETALVPLDYRYALDAAIARCFGQEPRLIFGGAPLLDAEARQRFPLSGVAWGQTTLWIEPSVANWQSQLADITVASQLDDALVVVASRPLAGLLPERRNWRGDPVGQHPGGIACLLRALTASGFGVREIHGIHSVKAMALTRLAQVVERLGRPDLGDRLQFAARDAYRVEGAFAPLATVALLVARKVSGP